MPKKQKRDNDYYLGRLEREFPVIHADYMAGRYPSVRAAAVAAGLREAPTPLKTLLGAWSKANPAERAEFLRRIGGVAAPATTPPIAVDGRLTAPAKARIETIMSDRSLSIGGIMQELGINSLNASLGMALSRNTKLKFDLIAKLEVWLAKQPLRQASLFRSVPHPSKTDQQ